MADEPKQTNGWRPPADPDAWHEQATPTPVKRKRFRLPTLPANLTDTPARTGGWRLPRRTDTTARPAPSAPRPEDIVPEPRPETQAAAPEDTAIYTPAEPRPEDLTFTETPPIAAEPRPEDLTLEDTRAPRPEDDVFAAIEAAEAAAEADEPDTAELDMDDAALADALADLDNDEDDAFGMSELLALQSLADEQPEGAIEQGIARKADVEAADEQDTTDLETLSPAERAALGLAPEGNTAQAPGSFDYAAQLAALQDGAAGTGTLDYSQGQPPVRVDEQTADSFDYATQLAELQGDDTGQTQALGDTPAYGAPTDPQLDRLAQQFSNTEQQVRELRQQRDTGLIPPEQFESQLRELMVLDNDNNWWMMGVDTEIWYRYDQGTGQWLVDTPPVQPSAAPRAGAVPTETGNFGPVEYSGQLSGGLPAFDGDDGYTAPDDPFSTAGQSPQTDYIPPKPVDPNDPAQTMVGDAAYQDSLGYNDPTVANMNAVNVGVEQPIEEDYQPVGAEEEYEDLSVVDRAEREQRRSITTTVLATAAVLVGILLISAAAIVGGFTLWYQNISERWAAQLDTLDLAAGAADFQTVIFYDAAGNEIAELQSEDGGARISVPLTEVSPFMIHATVSQENERFFQDPGFDVIAIGRAFLQNILGQNIVSGGSTITQQVARSIVLDDFTFEDEGDRKLNEIIVASELSRRYSKEEILEAYLNNIYFGNLQYGVEAAAQFYFDKPANNLELAESAMIAGLISRPAEFDPVTNKDAAIERMRAVLNRMTEANGNGCVNVPNQASALCITDETLRNVAASQIAQIQLTDFRPRDNEFVYPHFVVFVQERLQQTFTQEEIFRRGLRVYTTLNPRLQGAAQNALEDAVDSLGLQGVQTGTVMVTDPRTGAIQAMVGSPDFYDEASNGQINYALTYQQPGSAIKPITYATALTGIETDQNVQGYYTPATVLWDVPTTYPDGTLITNFDGRYRGPVSAREALQQSLNVPAVKAYAFVGEARFRQAATAMGIRFPDGAQFTLASGLGATEVRLFDMMEAYGTLANDGALAPLYAIERVEDADGNPVPFQREASTQAVPAPVAYLMQDIMSDDVARQPQFGVNNLLGSGYPEDTVAAKSGTSNEASDLWTIGYTNNIAVGVWLGTIEQNQSTSVDSAAIAAAPLWREVMDSALANIESPGPFTNVTGVRQQQYCTTTGTATDPAIPCPGPVEVELFVNNRPPPPATQGFVTEVTIDSWTRGLYDQSLCPDNPETLLAANIDDQTALAWLNSNPNGQQFAQRIGLQLPVVNAPQQTCGNTGVSILQASLNSPTQGQTINQVQIPIQGSINGGQNFSSYDIQVADANAPNNFVIVDGPFQQVPSGPQLGTWDAGGFNDGSYIVRLAINGQNGGYAYRTVQVNLDKPEPTPTPTFTPSPTVPPVPTSPPIMVPTSPGNGSLPTPIPNEASPIPFEDTQQDFSP